MTNDKISTRTMRIDIPVEALDEHPKAKTGVGLRRPARAGKAVRIVKTEKGKHADSAYTALLQGIYDAVLITNQRGAIIDVNARALEFFGRAKAELCKLNVLDVIFGADEAVLSTILYNLAEARFTIIDAQCVRKDGEKFPAEIAVNRMFLSQEGELCFLVRNVTRRQETEEKLRQANKMKSLHMLAGGVAHDFNNLLTSVIGNTELALSGLSMRSKATEDLAVALNDAKKMAELSHRMLAYSGAGLLRKAPVNLNSVVRKAVGGVSAHVPSRVNLEVKPGSEPIFVGGEGDVLVSMTTNVLLNAVEAMGNTKGNVTIACSVESIHDDFLHAHSLGDDIQPGEYACLKITDAGYGMDEVLVAKMFDPFFSTKGRGRGLGLSEVQGIVLAHGGRIAVETEIGKGSTFLVLLPLFKGAVTEARPRVPVEQASVAGATILVVDDEPSIRRYSRLILTKRGFSTILAEDGEDGVEQFRTHADEIDLVILDMFMPKMNGDEVLRRIRRIRPNIRALITSGYTESVYADRFHDEQPVGFLYKPFATDELIARITDALRA